MSARFGIFQMKVAIILLVVCVAYTSACAACGGKSKKYGGHSHSYQSHSSASHSRYSHSASHGRYSGHSSNSGCGPCGHGAPIVRSKKINYGDTHLSAGGNAKCAWAQKCAIKAQAVNPISTGAYLTSNPYSNGIQAKLLKNNVVAYRYKAPKIKTPVRRQSCVIPFTPAPACKPVPLPKTCLKPCPKPCPKPCRKPRRKSCPKPCPKPRSSSSYFSNSYSAQPSYSSYSYTAQPSYSYSYSAQPSYSSHRYSATPSYSSYSYSSQPRYSYNSYRSCSSATKKINYGDTHLSAGGNAKCAWAQKAEIKAQAVRPISTGAYLTSNPYSNGIQATLLKNSVVAYRYKAPQIKTYVRKQSCVVPFNPAPACKPVHLPKPCPTPCPPPRPRCSPCGHH